MIKRIFTLLFVSVFFRQFVFAWGWSENRYLDDRYNNRDTSYQFLSWSYKQRQEEWRINFDYSSSRYGKTYIPARDNFFKNPLYESKIRFESSNRNFPDFVRVKVAPNITGADYGGYKISDNTKFESYSSLNNRYESFSISNVREKNGKIESFDRTSGRPNWTVTENIRNISYKGDGRLSGYRIDTKDIAGNGLSQIVYNLRYSESPDSYRLESMLQKAETNSNRDGYYMWMDIQNGLEGMDSPAKFVPQSFNLRVIDDEGIRQEFAFKNVIWRNDRIVGFTANFMQDGMMTEIKTIPILNEGDKLNSLTVQIANAEGSQEKTWQANSRVNLGDFIAASFDSPNPLEILGAGHTQISDMIAPAIGTALKETGLLPNAKKDFARNYAIESKPKFFDKTANEFKKDIFRLEQTDRISARSILWDMDLNDLNMRDLKTVVANIQSTIKEKLNGLKNVREIYSEWGDTLKTNEPLDLKLEDNKIISSNEFTNSSGEKIIDVKFKINSDGSLKAMEGTKETMIKTKVGNGFDSPVMKETKGIVDSMIDFFKDFISEFRNFIGDIKLIKQYFIPQLFNEISEKTNRIIGEKFIPKNTDRFNADLPMTSLIIPLYRTTKEKFAPKTINRFTPLDEPRLDVPRSDVPRLDVSRSSEKVLSVVHSVLEDMGVLKKEDKAEVLKEEKGREETRKSSFEKQPQELSKIKKMVSEDKFYQESGKGLSQETKKAIRKCRANDGDVVKAKESMLTRELERLKSCGKNTVIIKKRIEDFENRIEDFKKIKNWLLKKDALKSENRIVQDLADEVASKGCCIVAHWALLKAEGKEKRSLSDFYLGEMLKGRITFKNHKSEAPVWCLTGDWNKRYGLKVLRGNSAENKPINKDKTLKLLNENNSMVAIVRADIGTRKNINNQSRPHFMLIMKDDQGIWRNMDHASHDEKRRGGKTNWEMIYRLIIVKR